MPHPADELDNLLRYAYEKAHSLGVPAAPGTPFAVVMGSDGSCSAFGLQNPPRLWSDAVDGLLYTLCSGAESGAYRVAGYCGADVFKFPTDFRNHLALHVHLEHQEGDAADYALALDGPVRVRPPRYEDWIRTDGSREIFGC